MYGDNEEMLGRYFKSRPDARAQVFLATKFSYKNNNTENDSSPEYIKFAIEQSLQKLGTDHVDLYYWQVKTGQICLGIALMRSFLLCDHQSSSRWSDSDRKDHAGTAGTQDVRRKARPLCTLAVKTN